MSPPVGFHANADKSPEDYLNEADAHEIDPGI
jgi:hypothetical protein